jgi:hypothetical protein
MLPRLTNATVWWFYPTTATSFHRERGIFVGVASRRREEGSHLNVTGTKGRRNSGGAAPLTPEP